MALFDTIVQDKEGFEGYKGDPPNTKAAYDAMKATMFSGTPPTWAKIKAEMDAYVDPGFTGNAKLLALGLSQAEATALTGYRP